MRMKVVAISLFTLLSLLVTATVPAAETSGGQSIGAPPPAFTPSHTDVVYVPGSAQPMHKLDIYTPTGPKPAGGYPLIVYVHGGGFERGDKYSPAGDDFRCVMKGLEKGYMVVSINYRLSGTDRAPAQIVDVKAAIRFVKAKAAAYGFNPERIALMGVSAGASIASCAATSAGTGAFDAELEAIGAVKGAENVKAVISFYGLYDFTRLQAQSNWLVNADDTSLDSTYLPEYGEARKFFLGKKAGNFNSPNSPEHKVLGGPLDKGNPMTARINAETYISASGPAFFIRHGGADETIPFLQSVDFARALKAKGNKVDFAVIPGAQHGIPGMNFFKIFDAEEMYSWLGRQM